MVVPMVTHPRDADSSFRRSLAATTRSSKLASRLRDRRGLGDPFQLLDDRVACDVAGGMAAHAVGDSPYAGFAENEEAVLIVLTHLAHVRGRAGLEP